MKFENWPVFPSGTNRPGSAGQGQSKAKRRPLNQAGRPTAAELERRKGRVMDVATELFV